MAGNKIKNEEKKNERPLPGEQEAKPESARLPAVVAEKMTVSKRQQDAQMTLELVVDKKDERVNAFTALALVLQAMREELEGRKRPEQLPRWIRIARVREFREDIPMNYISTKGVIPITEKFIQVVGYMAELTMKAQELLTQIDGARALTEVTAALVKTTTSKPFIDSVRETMGMKKDGGNPLSRVGDIVDNAMIYIDKIPDPEDVETMAKQLYSLLAVGQLDLPRTANGELEMGKLPTAEVVHIDKANTGKVRLLSWAFEKPIFFVGSRRAGANRSVLGGLTEGVSVTRLGSRRVWEAEGDLPTKASLVERYGNENLVVYEYDYSGENAGKDVEEANALLEEHGYAIPESADKKIFDIEFAKRLRRFQKINDLPITGGLDNPTINRLMNLDWPNGTLRRAKAFSDASLEGFNDAENPEPDKQKK